MKAQDIASGEEERWLWSRPARETYQAFDEELVELDELDSADLPPGFTPKWMRGQGYPRNNDPESTTYFPSSRTSRPQRSVYWWIVQSLILVSSIITISVLVCGLFFPSYSNPPRHYVNLRERASLGSGVNLNTEKVFIAASLHDAAGVLLGGGWANSVTRLIDLLGPHNVFLSIYENDPDEEAQAALASFSRNVTCRSEIVAEPLPLDQLPHITDIDGRARLKRIEFLANVRNRVLRPLHNVTSPAHAIRFDKLLYLNDVIFDPIDAANLLFSTNLDMVTGRTKYLAACAVDFINPFKFYDTYATRDLEGYTLGVPFYPWFAGASRSESRNDVLLQKDAVRVKSCWGGMVAFEAKWFQPALHESLSNLDQPEPSNPNATAEGRFSHPTNSSALHFRAETDTFWEASECCLIHADLSTIASSTLNSGETGIYMNPYIRVAYTSSVLPWLSVTRRFERLYPPVHTLVNWIANRPSFNPRQHQEPGEEVIDNVWHWDSNTIERGGSGEAGVEMHPHGHFAEVKRKALPGGFCGMRKLSYMNEDRGDGDGSSPWRTMKPPIIG